MYTGAYAWFVGGEAISQSVPWLYSSIAISGASLFALSYLYSSRKLERVTAFQRILLAFFDLGTYFCIVVLVVWGLVFPILRPITDPNFQLYLLDQKSLAMGLYTGLVLCSVVIVFRIALQLLMVRSNTITIIAPSKPQFGNSIPARGPATEDSSLESNLSSIRLEIGKLREEIASLSTPNTALRLTNLVGAVEVPANNRESAVSPVSEMQTLPSSLTETFVQDLPASDSVPQETGMEEMANDEVFQPEESSPTPSVGGPQIPDSARDNPWASVLSKRQPTAQSKPPPKRKTNKRAKRGTQKEKPSPDSPSIPTEAVKQQPESTAPIPDVKPDDVVS